MRTGLSPTAPVGTGQERRVQQWQRGREPAVLVRPDGDASRQVDQSAEIRGYQRPGKRKSASWSAQLWVAGKSPSRWHPNRIKPFLPATLAGLSRTQASAERNAALGLQISKAAATYSDGANRNLHLEITDTGSLKGLVGFAAGWAGVEQESENDSGYDKTYKSGGQLVHENGTRTVKAANMGS